MNQSRKLRDSILYVGDLIGVRSKDQEDENGEYSLGQAGDKGRRPVEEIERQFAKPHFEIPSGEFFVTWDGIEERTYARDSKVDQNVYLLDRSYLEVGSRVRRPGCAAVTGYIGKKEVFATVVLPNGLDCLVNIPIERLYKGIVKPIGQKFFNGSTIGQIESADYEVCLHYTKSDSCTSIVNIPRHGHSTLGLGQGLSWPPSKMKTCVWGNSPSFLSRKIKEIEFANKIGHVSNITMKSFQPSWAYDIETDTRIYPTNDDGFIVEPNVPIKLFPPVEEYGHRCEFTITFTPEDLDNIRSIRDWGDTLFAVDDNNDEPVAKSPRIQQEAYIAGNSYPVTVKLIQSKLIVEWDLNGQDKLHDELFSCEVEEVMDLSTLDIPHPTYVRPRFLSEDMKNHVGLVMNNYAGESDLSAMNPTLNNFDNMKEVKWFKINSNFTEFIETNTTVSSVYEIVPIPTVILKDSILVTESVSVGPKYIIGNFDRILESGMILIRDLDNIGYERWPTQIRVYNGQNLGMHNIFQSAIDKKNISQVIENPLLRFDFNLQSAKYTSLAVCPQALGNLPQHKIANTERLTQELWKLRLTSTQRNGQWYITYTHREDIISFVVIGSVETGLEGMLFTLHVQLPESFPEHPPIIQTFHGLTKYQVQRLKSFPYKWTPKSSILGFFSAIQSNVLLLPRDLDVPNMKVKTHSSWIPLENVYDEAVFSTPLWNNRWKEAAKIQEIDLVFRKLTQPAQSQLERQVKGHYANVLQRLLVIWRGWVNEARPHPSIMNVDIDDFPPSTGFKMAVENVCRMLEELFQSGDAVPGPSGNNTVNDHDDKDYDVKDSSSSSDDGDEKGDSLSPKPHPLNPKDDETVPDVTLDKSKVLSPLEQLLVDLPELPDEDLDMEEDNIMEIWPDVNHVAPLNELPEILDTGKVLELNNPDNEKTDEVVDNNEDIDELVDNNENTDEVVDNNKNNDEVVDNKENTDEVVDNDSVENVHDVSVNESISHHDVGNMDNDNEIMETDDSERSSDTVDTESVDSEGNISADEETSDVEDQRQN